MALEIMALENKNKPKIIEGIRLMDDDGTVLHAEMYSPSYGYLAVISARVAEKDEEGSKMYDEQGNPVHGDLKYDFAIRKEGSQRSIYEGTNPDFNEAYSKVIKGFSKELTSNRKDISDKTDD